MSLIIASESYMAFLEIFEMAIEAKLEVSQMQLLTGRTHYS